MDIFISSILNNQPFTVDNESSETTPNFSQIQNSPHYPRGGGQENYGLFPQFVTFPFWIAPLSMRMFDTNELQLQYKLYV